MCCFPYFLSLWRTKTRGCSPIRPLYPSCAALRAQTPVNHQWLRVVFLERGRGIKQIEGRSKSILSSAILSLQALIRCCQCPLTDVFIQRSGPSSHAATTPPDTQQTQQQLNKQGHSVMPEPIASLSAIHSSLHLSIHPYLPQPTDWLCSGHS